MLAVLAIVMLGGLLLGANGCSSGGSSSTGSGLTAGTYAVTITGADANNSLVPQVSSTFNVVVN